MATLTFRRAFSDPFSTGSGGQTVEVPDRYDVGIGGRGYMLDRTWLASYPMISTIRSTRAQSDQSPEPGEQSLTPDDLWRRSQDTWHFGAGQAQLDHDDSLRTMFNTSKGVYVWEEGQISLLNDTAQSLSSANTNLTLMPAGARLYVADNTALKYCTDVTASSWTTVTGTSGVAITDLASDGVNVWIADGASVYKTDTGIGTAASWSTTDVDRLGYVHGRLMYSDGNILGYCSDFSTPTFTALFTHELSSFTWVGFGETNGYILAGGYAGDKSFVYKITITAEGTALGAPTVAGRLPDGEILHSIGSYLGYVLLGTSAGVRFCAADSNGFLTIGELIETANPVKCFEGQSRYVWFGMTNFDATSTGLGRIGLRSFPDLAALRPAYASDLMVTAQATVLSVCTFGDLRVFSVSGNGVYYEDTANLVASGTLQTGQITFGITEQKIPRYVDITVGSGFDGSIKCEYATNGSQTFTNAGTHTTTATSWTFPITENALESIELKLTLTAGTNDVVLHRLTTRAIPIPVMRRKFILPLLLTDTDHDANDRPYRVDVNNELSLLDGLRSTKQVVAIQIGNEAYSCSLEDYDFIATHPTRSRSLWNGTCIVQFKTA